MLENDPVCRQAGITAVREHSGYSHAGGTGIYRSVQGQVLTPVFQVALVTSVGVHRSLSNLAA